MSSNVAPYFELFIIKTAIVYLNPVFVWLQVHIHCFNCRCNIATALRAYSIYPFLISYCHLYAYPRGLSCLSQQESHHVGAFEHALGKLG